VRGSRTSTSFDKHRVCAARSVSASIQDPRSGREGMMDASNKG